MSEHAFGQDKEKRWSIMVRYLFTIMSFIVIFSPMSFAASASSEKENSKEIVVGVLKNWPPHYLTDGKTGKPDGFAIEIMDKAAELSGLTIRYSSYNRWPEIHEAVRKKEVMVVPNIGITLEREDSYDFTTSYETFQIVTFVRSSSTDIWSLDDLAGKNVGVVEYNKGVVLMQKRGGSNLRIFPSLENTFLALLSGNVDAVVYPKPVVLKLALNSGLEDKIKIVGTPLFEVKRGIAVRKGEQEIYQKLDNAVRQIIKTPDYKNIYEKWFGKPKPFWDVRRVLIMAVIILVLTISALLFIRHRAILNLNKALLNSIADHKRARGLLKESESVLKKSQSMAHVGSWRLDLKKNHLYWSDEVFEIFGLNLEEFEATYEAYLQAVHPDDRSAVELAYTNAVKEHQPYDITHRILRPDGTIRFVHEKTEDIRDESGEIVMFIGMIHDITESKQMAIKLQESEERFRQIFENINVGIAIYTSRKDGNDFTFTDINPYGAQSGRKMRGEHIGKSVLDVYPGVVEMGLFSVFQEVWRTGKPKNYPISQYRDEKILLWVENYITKLPSGEIMAVYEDLTSERNAENELKKYREHLEELVAQRTAEIEIKNKELETFTYSVSHDLKAPLRGIDGYSRLLTEEYADRLDGEGLKFLSNIRLSAEQMNQLIEDLLAYSRMERRSIHTATIDLKTLVELLISERQHDIETGQIQIDIQLPFCSIWADSDTLRQVIGNYLDNAIKFSKEMKLPVVEIGGIENDNSWTIWVKDNGIGFDVQYHDRIFQIFQRLHRIEEYPGTGVGLAIVRKAVERMGGRVWAESTIDKGATFYVEIPKK